MKYLTIALTLSLLTACGFHPLYGQNKYTPVSVEEKLAHIEISNIPDREGQILRNALIDRFYRDGRPASAQYILTLRPIEERLIDLDITKNSDATRGQLRLQTSFSLKDKASGEELLTRKVSSISSYNILNNEFSTRVSEDNTRRNGLNDLARQIEHQINLYLKRTQ